MLIILKKGGGKMSVSVKRKISMVKISGLPSDLLPNKVKSKNFHGVEVEVFDSKNLFQIKKDYYWQDIITLSTKYPIVLLTDSLLKSVSERMDLVVFKAFKRKLEKKGNFFKLEGKYYNFIFPKKN